ncbi:MAG TPA: DHHA1 domain-containing protein, partial [Pseudomonadales bacterium]|nr:DHHA1 domain-containing protein [Pseudomonadales bacterium]
SLRYWHEYVRSPYVRFAPARLLLRFLNARSQNERMVNEHIRANTEVSTRLMNIDDARAAGAMALFGEKYDDQVRVLSMGKDEFSIELCGGTHASRTGDIGLLKITSEGGIAAGVRRIEAVVGEAALDFIAAEEATLSKLAHNFKTSNDKVLEKVEQLQNRAHALEKELEAVKAKNAQSAGNDLATQAKDINGIKVLSAQLAGADVDTLRNTMDQLKNKLGSGLIMLASDNDGKVTLLAGVTKDLIGKAKAGDAVKECAPYVDGRGGGKPEMAQAGGQNPAGISDALAAFEKWAAAVTA